MVGGEDHSRRAGVDLRRRRHAVVPAELAVGARLEHQRRQLQHRRRDGELAGRRRRRDDDLLRPGDVRGSELHDLGDPGRSDGRRRVDQHGDQGRRQQVARQRALQLHQRLPDPAEPARRVPRKRQPERRARPRARQPDAVGLRPQLRRRRRARQGSALGERLGPSLDHQQAGQRQERRRHPGDRRQHAEELFRQGSVLAELAAEDVVLLQLGQQDARPSPRHAAEPRARHRVAGPGQPGRVDAGEIHRHQEQDGVRVVVQHHEGRDRLLLSAEHAGDGGARRRHAGGQGVQRRAAQRAAAELADPVRQHACRTRSPGGAAITCSRAASSSRGCTSTTQFRCRTTCG